MKSEVKFAGEEEMKMEDQDMKNIFAQWTHLRESLDGLDTQSYENQTSFLRAIQSSLDHPSKLMKSKLATHDDFLNVLSQLDSHIGASFVNDSLGILMPPTSKLFEWAKGFPIQEIKVVLINTSPSFKGSGKNEIVQVSGLAYQPLDKNNVSHHFKQLVKSIKKDNPLFIEFDDYNLNSWIDQKVLLLNCYSSGELVKNSLNSKEEFNCHGTWLKITRALVDHVFVTNLNAIFILVGPAVHERIYDNFLKQLDREKERVILVANPMTHKRGGDIWEFGEGLDVCNWKLKKILGLEASIDWTNLSRWDTPMAPPSTDPVGQVLTQSSIFKSAIITDGSAFSNQASFLDAVKKSVDLFYSESFAQIMSELDRQIGASPPLEVRPTKDKLFEFTKAIPIDKVKVVIVGYAPEPAKMVRGYNDDDTIRVTWDHLEGCGLAFHPHDKNNFGQSFCGIVESIKIHNPLFIQFDDYHLQSWIQQNVLLLNCYTSGYLTNLQKSKEWANRPEMKPHEAWLKITKGVVAHIFGHNPNSVFILVGKQVNDKLDEEFWHTLTSNMTEEKLVETKERIIQVTEPSLENDAQDGKEFAVGLEECNKFLEKKEGKEGCINWLNLQRW